MGGGRCVAVGAGFVSRGTLVTVGQIAVGVGPNVDVEEGVQVREAVSVKLEVALGKGVSVEVGLGVGVLNSVAKASIVFARSVLWVGVAVSSPVFGIIRSLSYSFCADWPVTMNGRPKAIAQVAIMMKKTKNPIFCTASFLSGFSDPLFNRVI